jgi:hypothetical protein
MPDYNTDGKHGLRALEGTNPISDIDAGFEALRDDLDDIIATDDQGALSSRPVSTAPSPGKAGRYYWATDTLALYRDHGTGWTQVYPVEDGAVTAAKVAAALKPSGSAEPATEALRALGTTEDTAAAGNDARLWGTRVDFGTGSIVGSSPGTINQYLVIEIDGQEYRLPLASHPG